MAKRVIRLTESDLMRLVKKVINEQEGDHPLNNNFYKQMTTDIDGEGVKVVSSKPNELIINAFGKYIYTITKRNAVGKETQ